MYLQRITAIGLCFWACCVSAGVFSEDFAAQKQLFIVNRTTNESFSCQMVRIHEKWFLTSAHCVNDCLKDRCDLQVLLAQGKQASAWATISDQEIVLPEKYKKGNSPKSIFWDVALLRYQPRRYEFRTNEGSLINRETFEKFARKDSQLRLQWEGAVNPELPELVVHSSAEMTELDDNVVVPRWKYGKMQYYSNPNHVLYTGKRQAMWVTDGFGVSKGNSGGGVWVAQDNGLLGIVSAKHQSALPSQVRRAYPQLGKTSEYFAFTGFAEKTTWKFIDDTLSLYGDKVKTKTLEQVDDSEAE